MILPEQAIRYHSPDKIVRYSLSVNARIVSLWMVPFEAIDRTAFATTVSSGASTVITISYWPVTMKNSLRVAPADSIVFRAASTRDGLSLMFSSPLLVQRSKQIYVGIPFTSRRNCIRTPSLLSHLWRTLTKIGRCSGDPLVQQRFNRFCRRSGPNVCRVLGDRSGVTQPGHCGVVLDEPLRCDRRHVHLRKRRHLIEPNPKFLQPGFKVQTVSVAQIGNPRQDRPGCVVGFLGLGEEIGRAHV